eukprot:jgi/Hompol1/6304/HPOL_004929-RA
MLIERLGFRFYKFGSWTEVVVDDYLPCTAEGEWICSLSGDRREVWVPLLEKACAKLNGSYQALKTLEPSTCVFPDFTEVQELRIRTGLFQKKSIQVVKLCKPFLSQLPLAKTADPDWSTHLIREIERLKLSIAQDGQFIVTFEEFVKNFPLLIICRAFDPPSLSTLSVLSLPSVRYTASRHFGKWSRADDSAGGCLNYASTVCNNPQYLVDMRRSGEMIFYLQRLHANHPTTAGTLSMGFVIFKVEENRDFRIGDSDYQIWYESAYTNHCEVLGRCMMSEGRFVVVPTLQVPGHEGDFLLRTYSSVTAVRIEVWNNSDMHVVNQLLGFVTLRVAEFATSTLVGETLEIDRLLVCSSTDHDRTSGFMHLRVNALSFSLCKLRVNIGRKSDYSGHETIDIVMDDDPSLTIKHMQLQYNFEIQRFDMTVYGKSGVRLNGVLVRPQTRPVQIVHR